MSFPFRIRIVTRKNLKGGVDCHLLVRRGVVVPYSTLNSYRSRGCSPGYGRIIGYIDVARCTSLVLVQNSTDRRTVREYYDVDDDQDPRIKL